jgi:hypothetical protein
MTKSSMPNAENALNIEVAISEARDSIKRIEGTTNRINKIVQEATPLSRSRRRDDDRYLSIRFTSVALIFVVVILGLFGVLFFNITQYTHNDIENIIHRVNQLEQAIKPPLHNSGK